MDGRLLWSCLAEEGEKRWFSSIIAASSIGESGRCFVEADGVDVSIGQSLRTSEPDSMSGEDNTEEASECSGQLEASAEQSGVAAVL